MGRIRSFTLAWPMVPLLASCASEAASPDFVVRDSAGVRIVESGAPVWEEGRGWHVEPEPALHIGAAAGTTAVQLHQVRDALRLPDGRVAVANGGSGEIRFFGPDGEHLLSAGGQGEGPGEFASLEALFAWPGDTLLAWDGRLARLSLFTSEGRFVRALTLDAPAGVRPRVEKAFGDGSVLARWPSEREDRPSTGWRRPDWNWAIFAPDGSRAASLDPAPATQTYVHASDDMVIVLGGTPFGRVTATAVHRDRLFLGTADRYEIRVLDPRGALRSLIRRPVASRAVTEADRRAFEEAQRDQGDEIWRRISGDVMGTFTYPETMPAYREIRADAAGNLWVREVPASGEREDRTWSVFDPEGRWLGTVEMPARLTVFRIGTDHVLGRWRDEVDVEYVRLHRLVKGGE